MASPARLLPLAVLVALASACAAPAGTDDEAATAEGEIATAKAEWRARSTWGANKPQPVAGIEWTCATDLASQRVLCFPGGAAAATTSSSVTPAPTYALDGDTYAEVAPATASPPGRSAFSMASFGSKKQVVVFGGRKRQGVLFDDTWTWNGTSWKLEAPAHRPPARMGGTLVEDPVSKHLVLFGGSNEQRPFQDLWEWDGADWKQLPVSTDQYAPSSWASLAVAALPSKDGLLVVDALEGKGWTLRGGTFTALPAGTVPRIDGFVGPRGALVVNPDRGTIEAFIPSNGRTKAYEIRSGEGIAFTALPLVAASDGVRTAAWDPKRRSSVVFTGPRAFDLGWAVVPNQAPALTVPSLFPQVFAEETLSFQVTATDPDDEAKNLAVTATGLPSGATFDAATRTFTWTPTPAQKGTHVVKLSARDGALTTRREVRIEVLHRSYPMLPTGPVDQLTTGVYVDSWMQWKDGDRRMLGGLFAVPTHCERRNRWGQWQREACPWPYGNVAVACRFTGKNPGKVTASCLVNREGAQGMFLKSEVTVDEAGGFGLGRLISVPNEGPAMRMEAGSLFPLNDGLRIVQNEGVTSLLRPMPQP